MSFKNCLLKRQRLVQVFPLLTGSNLACMKVRDLKVLRGPNYWFNKRHTLIQLTLDLEELEHKPTDALPGFYERLQTLKLQRH